MGGGEVRVNKGWMKVLGSAFSFLVLSCPCIRGGGVDLEVEASALGKGEFHISSSSPWAGSPVQTRGRRRS